MADMRNLGEILQRAGAGFQGNLAQFDASRAQQQMLTEDREERKSAKAKALSMERATAAAQDAQVALQFLEAGATDKALELVDNRLGFIKQFQGDPTDTQAVRDLIAKGDLDTAKSELKLFTTEAEARGLIKPLISAADRIKQDELALNKAEFRAKYGYDAGSAPAGGAPGGSEGEKLRIEQQRAAIEAQKAAREQAAFNAQQRDIPTQWQKPYLDSVEAELGATQKAAELSQLAADFEAAPEVKAGARATFDETAKKFFGEQDAVTALRERFRGARNVQALRNLPPGPATDKDIELALSGFPADNASKENIASFLRGQVKIQALDAAYQRFKVDYLDKNKTLRGINEAWRGDAERVFGEIQKEIGRPLNTSYTIQDYEAEARKRGLIN